ncbi:DeoR family transcriptional regulator [Dactylosporangium sp. NPDC050588]|uniref:DeoR family transcriptional regulator n=1 Tax=Dactylosporangium sp. NPDC050588 TaxID=3157211 RepID=UPI0033F8A7E3
MSTEVLAAVRHRRILALLAAREFVTVTEVRAATGASLATANRDLSVLAAAGALTRIRGGATRAAPPPAGPSGQERVLVACLVQARRAAERHDLAAVEGALHQALTTCRQLRDRHVSDNIRPPRKEAS